IASVVPGQPGSAIYLRENTPRSMGALSNFFILAAYSAAFEQGDMDPSRKLDWDSISKYQLPQVGETIHQAAYREGLEKGFIEEDGTIRTDHAVRLLADNNSLALADYLLIRLGKEPVRALYEEMNLDNTDPPLPFSGLFITLAPSIQRVSHDSLLAGWSSEPRAALEESAYMNSERFSAGDVRDEWLEILQEDRLGNNFMQERDLLALFPQTTANDITRALTDVWNGDFISEDASKRILDWLLYADETAISRNFREYAALYDNRIGLLNGIDAGISADTGETTIQAVFFDQIHIAVWFHMSSNHMHQDFQQRLIWDPELKERMKDVTERFVIN
ncbi:MAG: hypothetical protein WEC12_01795, partial [Balneolaceae bacterium]